MTFSDNGTQTGTAVDLVNGQAALTTNSLAVGNHTITANYGGDPNYGASSGSLAGNPQVVKEAATATATSVASSVNPSVLGQPVTFAAKVAPISGSGTPTGTVTFYDNGTSIGTGTLSGGRVSLATSTLAAGTHSITASYGGDPNFSASTSAPLSQLVIGPAPGQVGHLMVAKTNIGLIYGLFSVNPITGIGTYTQAPFGSQGLVTGMGVVQQRPGLTQVSALGNNLRLGGQLHGRVNQFTETAPLHATGTFSLS